MENESLPFPIKLVTSSEIARHARIPDRTARERLHKLNIATDGVVLSGSREFEVFRQDRMDEIAGLIGGRGAMTHPSAMMM